MNNQDPPKTGWAPRSAGPEADSWSDWESAEKSAADAGGLPGDSSDPEQSRPARDFNAFASQPQAMDLPVEGEESSDLADTVDATGTIDELAVYLDGGLEDSQRQSVEQRLLKDEQARHELAALQSSWDALDWLPRPVCSEQFTESTMKLVVQRELAEQRTTTYRTRRVAVGLATAVGILASFGVGYIWAQWLNTAEERAFLESYRLIEDWEKYQAVGEFEFLLSLDREALFAREVSDVAP